MRRSAQLLITSYDRLKVDQGYRKILATKPKGVDVGRPKIQKVEFTKDQPIIWGCNKNDLRQMSIPITGSIEDLKKLISIKTIEGVYMQLLLEKELDA
ncbi:MAG TPA: hypothetical protein VND01_00750 [Candidatus Acidoferrales bacterium]|nr:hypothetical protein [Candidatus Acidoferrales bacterium]